MQKLERRNTYTPTDAPQVCSHCDLVLNSNERDSVRGLKTLSNNSKVDQCSGMSKQDSRVLVLNMRGEPLMPTRSGKAKRLLKEGKAKVVRRTPFVIQLNYPTGEAKQPIVLGIDSGYTFIGFSAVTQKDELLRGEFKLRKDVSKKLDEKRGNRRLRRSQKWYRPPRFDNRKKEKGWFAPSIKHKLDTHVRLVELIKSILPITKVIVEIATFDTQKMQNPEIKGVEYQQGELQGYEVREYLLEKWGRKCAYCKVKNKPLEIEHIIPKSRGGSNRVSNLTIVCHDCNQEKDNLTADEFGHPEIQKQANKTLKAPAFMNTVRKELVEILKCNSTYGYVTKCNRIKAGLEKSHSNDAFVIAGGTNQKRTKELKGEQNRRNNRKLQINRKKFGISIRRQRHQFQPGNLVRYEGKAYKSGGTTNYGTRVYLKQNEGKINVNSNKVELINFGKGINFI